MNELNWAAILNRNATSKECAERALKRAKAIEKKRIKEGWRYYKLNATNQILIPYGKDGKPTKKGLEMIKRNENL